MTAGVPEGTTGEWEDYLPPEKPNTTPVKGVNIGGKPFTVFYDESGKQVGDPVAEYNEPRAAGTTRPPTGAQNRALNFYNRMQDALGTIEATESQLNDKDRALIGNIPANGWLESGAFLLLSDAGKSYSRAMKQFTEARLRKDSGAAVPANEYVSDLRTYGARVGDTPASAAERLRGRRETAESVAFEAGPAFEAFYGEPFRRGMLTPSTAPAEAQTGRSAAPPRRLTQGADGAIREGRPAAAPAPPVKKKTRLTVGPNGQLVEVEVK
jgi:hypothetical protein